MKKKPARQPRKIEVVEDAPVATKAEPKAKKTKATKARTVAPEPQPEPPTPTAEPNATVAKSGAKKGKTKAEAPAQSERKPEQPSTIARVEGKLEGKLSAIDAAAKVLEGGSTLNCKELIAEMAAQGLWTSPGGKTPHATLYSAILREMTVKGSESRFVKTERGRFAKR